MRLLLLASMLLPGLVPGLGGAIEDAAHLLAEGHTLHVDDHDASAEVDHAEHDDPTSDCDDCGHDGFCHCHGGPALAAAPAPSPSTRCRPRRSSPSP
ncbi:MAG: hypothetical protein CMN30_02655 [Sandaracinus sp.]|nr:hypothetical protein [Sandaracinus sp.]